MASIRREGFSAGQLRHELMLGKMTHKPGPVNTAELIQIVTVSAECFGDARPMNGVEQFRNRNIREEETMVFITRYDPDLRNTSLIDHIIHCDRLFKIYKTENFDERRNFLKFICIELGPAPTFVIEP